MTEEDARNILLQAMATGLGGGKDLKDALSALQGLLQSPQGQSVVLKGLGQEMVSRAVDSVMAKIGKDPRPLNGLICPTCATPGLVLQSIRRQPSVNREWSLSCPSCEFCDIYNSLGDAMAACRPSPSPR